MTLSEIAFQEVENKKSGKAEVLVHSVRKQRHY